MSWEKIKLSNCCISIADGDHQPPPKSKDGIPFVTIANIENNQFDFTNAMFVPKDYYEKLDDKRKPQKDDSKLVFRNVVCKWFINKNTL